MTLVAATVVGPCLIMADAYATAAVVMGESALRWAESVPHDGVLVVGPVIAMIPRRSDAAPLSRFVVSGAVVLPSVWLCSVGWRLTL